MGEKLLSGFNRKERNMYEQKLIYNKCNVSIEKKHKKTHPKNLQKIELFNQAESSVCLHVERVRHLCKLLCFALAKITPFTKIITPGFIETVCLASTFHDLGKVEIESTAFLMSSRTRLESASS